MYRILSHRIDKESGYDDIPFQVYHFPKRYRNQIFAKSHLDCKLHL